MTSVLYYSNYCSNCTELLQLLAKSKVKDEIHFICIDRRMNNPKGGVLVVLPNGSNLPLPEGVTKVPAMLLLNKGNNIIFGKHILEFLQPREEEHRAKAVMHNGEPLAYMLGGGGGGGSGYGVVSDNYSFLDQSADSMKAQGDGGLRQMHNYAALEGVDNIDTPPDNYEPDKVKGESVDTIAHQRDSDVGQIPR